MAKDSAVIDLPLGLIKKSSNGGSTGRYGRFSDVYYNIGDKESRLTVNPAPGIQNPTKGLSAGKECNPTVIKKLVTHKDTKCKMCAPNKDGDITGICGYRQVGKQQITLFYLNNGGDAMTKKDVAIAQKAIIKHCSVREDTSVFSDEFDNLYS